MKAGLIKIFIAIIGRCPIGVCQRLGRWVGQLLWYMPNSLKTVTRININHCYPNLNKAEQQKLIRDSLSQDGMTYAEMPHFWHQHPKHCISYITEVIGKKPFDDSINKGKGLIVLVPHQGAWELINFYLSSHYAFACMYRKPKIEALDKLISQSRSKLGTTMLSADLRGVLGLFRALKQGKVVCILPDQDPGESGGIYAPFFKHEAWTMVLGVKLAQKSKAPVFFGMVERLDKTGQFRLHLKPANPLLDSDNLEEAVATMNQNIMDCVALNPAQYQWGYKRFKRQRPGEKDWYDN